jgi:23S rRNA pseudouridine1911/1915/1917 synthase
MKYTLEIKPSDHNKKLMDVLAHTVGMSRLLIKKIRLYGQVIVNGHHHRMIDPVCAGDFVILKYMDDPLAHPAKISDRGDIRVLYSDEHLFILDKPAGMVTHHTSLHQSNTLLDHFSDMQLHPVSRLDRETSGIILIARDPHTHYRLSLQQQSQKIKKIYTAVNYGIFPFCDGSILAPIKREPASKMLRCVAHDGSRAETSFKCLQSFPKTDVSVNQFRIHTGRTHQIRIHSLFCGHPIVGDGLYGPCSRENHHLQKSSHLDSIIGRQALHASRIAFSHPITGEKLEIHSDLPPDITDLIRHIQEEELS